MSNYVTSIINVDSVYRNKYPKHVYEMTNTINNTQIILKANSNILSINYNNHNLNIDDNIIISNIESNTVILLNSIYLIKNTSYAIIQLDNDIVKNYNDYINKIYANINILNNDLDNYYNNIPYNILTGVKEIFIYSDLNNELKKYIYNFVIDKYNIDVFDSYYDENPEVLNNKFILFNTNIIFSSLNDYDLFKSSIEFSFLDICGVNPGYINANYPITDYQYQSSHMVTNIVNNNTFEIQINKTPFCNRIISGDNINIFKILNTIDGYEESNDYSILLNRTYNNIINIELLSSEIPYVDIVIKKDVNDKFFWKILNDGNHLYNIVLLDGFYTLRELIDNIETLMNKVERNVYNIENPIYNIFEINYNVNNFYIEFKSYENIKLSNVLYIERGTVDNVEYYFCTISINNNLNKNDNITISDADDIIFLDNGVYKILNKNYINRRHVIYLSNLNIEIVIIIGKVSDINVPIYNNENNNDEIKISSGGKMNIKIPNRFSLLFDRNNTIGEILGFKKINTRYSITNFLTSIDNRYKFINDISLNFIDNSIKYTTDILNLSGQFNYMLMYLNNIDYINNKNLPPCFAKILLPVKPGTILFNTFVIHNNNTATIFPINKLYELNILFLYPDGSKVDFRNLNHSFTIKITEQVSNDN